MLPETKEDHDLKRMHWVAISNPSLYKKKREWIFGIRSKRMDKQTMTKPSS